jgi:hypothetical protein
VPVYPTTPELWSQEVLEDVARLLRRLERVCDLIVTQAAMGDPFFRRHLAEGHLDGYRRDLAFVESLRAPLQEALEDVR